MAAAVLFAFLLGLSLGVYLGRRNAVPRAERPATTGAASVDQPAPNKRARKAGLSEADFRPADDILERLRKAAEGELDPAEIDAPPPRAETADEAEAAARAELAEKERRILERLRQQEAERREG